MTIVRAIGMMSGTSLDGVDVALIETDGERVAAFGPTGYRPYDAAERRLLQQALADAKGLTDRTARPGVLAEAENLITRAHAEALDVFLTEHRVARETIAIVGFHGQTVLHRPAQRLTVQLGRGADLARHGGIPVAFDFRAADVAAGGQGAPLVPVYHCALVGKLGGAGPVMVVNIGGVANVTYCESGRDPIACDTGPGNAPIDDFLRARNGPAFDDGGAIAAKGTVDDAFIARVLRKPYFDLPPPKSLDRNDFADVLADVAAMPLEDGVGSLTMLTAATIACVISHLPQRPVRAIIAGGGARNRTLVAMLEKLLQPTEVMTADAAGWSGDALEAQAFAFLAVRARRGLPLTFPDTTGVAKPLTGGVIARP